jgi:hypothetical protein
MDPKELKKLSDLALLHYQQFKEEQKRETERLAKERDIQQHYRDWTKASKIIRALPELTEQSAKNGEYQCIVMYLDEREVVNNKPIGAAKFVRDYCMERGFKTRLDGIWDEDMDTRKTVHILRGYNLVIMWN